ncbi:PhoPQ-activated pathogenicity-related protein [Polystyrenella longa]|uniref:PhoPQ-activated pathogenicity-related protein n=2 Tax=Polystyrenella longa TaxID=2528007 RepID=A0A518CJN1_9PLAN|nr:PhoPQ-activated pathogenicity-related protein [Polystyrenella longa]
MVCLLVPFSSVSSADSPERTALDDYVSKSDDSYQWEVFSDEIRDGVRVVIIDMVSQNWRTTEDVDRTEWRHWLTLCIPEKVDSRIGTLIISGGANGKSARTPRIAFPIAQATNTVVAELGMVPNQPLIFHGDGIKRSEDEIVAYTWDQYIKTGDVSWPIRNPMVKSAVRALDTMTAFMASDAGGQQKVDQFIVGGASKRGWTTWLTGALDDRVVAIMPIVIDVLNTDISMRHHFESYGFYAPSVGDYAQNRIMERMNHPRVKELYELVDPYYYRDRLDMPKLVLNASGDQFFLPDSSQFYWEHLIGDNYLRYVPNADHSLRDSDAMETASAFVHLIAHDKPIPKIDWTEGEDGSLIVTAEGKPKEVKMWQAHNEESRDFRLEKLGPKYESTTLKANSDGNYIGKIDTPAKGWTAYFVEVTYDVGAATPLKLTTQVNVLPDVEPFEGKDPNLPTSLTLICTAPSENAAKALTKLVETMYTNKEGIAGRITTATRGKVCYINLEPKGDFRKIMQALGAMLKTQNCENFEYQIESGPDITFPPSQK